jgi:hypothetical protein
VESIDANGAARYFEQINAFDCWRDHDHPADLWASVFRTPTVCQSLDEERNLPM